MRKIPLPPLVATMETLREQKQVAHEVILVEAHHSLEVQQVIDRFEGEHIRSIEHDNDHFDSLIQKGIDEAKGEYINIIRPGEYYLSKYALETISEFIDANDGPDVVICGRVEHRNNQQSVLFHPLDIPSLKCGSYPPTLEHIWLKKTIFEKTGKFQSDYKYKGKFDFYCRLAQANLRIVQFRRVLTDSHRLKVTLKNPLSEGREMLRIITSHFGPLCAFKWWFTHNQKYFFSALLQTLKKSFSRQP
ncbi:MAG: hypothetical protein KDK50_00365 [Chlamydiia bacterium]|nr:hypothetical protein [Chlamydiia bacterium]